MMPRFNPVPRTFSNYLNLSIACTKQIVPTCFNQSPGDNIDIIERKILRFSFPFTFSFPIRVIFVVLGVIK